MSRILARSSHAFMSASLAAMNKDTETSFSAIRDAVGDDPAELEATRKVLKVLVMQKHALQTGEGDSATYRLTDSGEALLNALGGR